MDSSLVVEDRFSCYLVCCGTETITVRMCQDCEGWSAYNFGPARPGPDGISMIESALLYNTCRSRRVWHTINHSVCEFFHREHFGTPLETEGKCRCIG